jgi:hypothetical protein
LSIILLLTTGGAAGRTAAARLRTQEDRSRAGLKLEVHKYKLGFKAIPLAMQVGGKWNGPLDEIAEKLNNLWPSRHSRDFG